MASSEVASVFRNTCFLFAGAKPLFSFGTVTSADKPVAGFSFGAVASGGDKPAVAPSAPGFSFGAKPAGGAVANAGGFSFGAGEYDRA